MSAPPIGRVIRIPNTRAQAKKIQIQVGGGQQKAADAKAGRDDHAGHGERRRS